MPRNKAHNKPYRVTPGRKPDEIDDVLYEIHQQLRGVWPPNATYICSRCGHGGPLAEFKMERDFGAPERRQCLECAKTPRPEPKTPTVSVKPKRPNRAAEIAAARIRYEEDHEAEHHIRMVEEHPEIFGLLEDDN